jgi:hypothetical protein
VKKKSTISRRTPSRPSKKLSENYKQGIARTEVMIPDAASCVPELSIAEPDRSERA